MKVSNILEAIALLRKEFSQLPDSKDIASLTALRAIYGLSLIHPPLRVLEVGTGIGTITAFLLKFSDARIVSVEYLSRFREASRHNLKEYFDISDDDIFGRVNLADSLNQAYALDLSKIDWIIVDAPFPSKYWSRISQSKSSRVIVIENQRHMTRIGALISLLKHKRRFSYHELDSESETGICAIILNSHGTISIALSLLDFLAACIQLIPKFFRSTIKSHGKNLRLNSLKRIKSS